MKLITYNHFKADPYFNMAFDEWMLQKVLNHSSLICVRLYSWSIGAITFGYNQISDKAFDNDLIGETPVIRRVTGGRGLFHDTSELTYSIAVSADLIDKKVVSDSITGASSEFAKILMKFLKKLNIRSDFIKNSSHFEKEKDFFHSAPCFASFSKNEIINDSKKIIASAQRRVFGALLQHGSIKINGVKHHPALPLKGYKSMSFNGVNELLLSDFNRYCPLFISTFEDYFSVQKMQCDISETDKNDLISREIYIKKYSTEKRDSIKQSLPLMSLLDSKIGSIQEKIA